MQKAQNKSNILLPAILGAAISALLLLGLLIGASALISGGALPETIEKELMIVLSFISAAVGALAAIKRRGREAIRTGLTAANLYLLIVLMAVALSREGSIISGMMLSIFISTEAAGIFAAAISARPKKSRGSRRKK